jgi:hypothetical protein
VSKRLSAASARSSRARLLKYTALKEPNTRYTDAPASFLTEPGARYFLIFIIGIQGLTAAVKNAGGGNTGTCFASLRSLSTS